MPDDDQASPARFRCSTIEVPGGPHGFALHPEAEPMCVSLESDGRVSVVRSGSREDIRVADIGETPTGIIDCRGLTLITARPARAAC